MEIFGSNGELGLEAVVWAIIEMSKESHDEIIEQLAGELSRESFEGKKYHLMG